MEGKVTLLIILLYTTLVEGTLYQRHDGWYNNLIHPSWGSIGDDISSKELPVYKDLTYMIADSGLPNPRDVSNQVFSGPSGMPSFQNRTVLFTYFGQMLSAEVVTASESSCPVELLRVKIPDKDPYFKSNDTKTDFIPFVRSNYDKRSGQAPNHPRHPINAVTSWLDASFVYGRGQVWTSCLRAYKHGKLVESTAGFPGINKLSLPIHNNQLYGKVVPKSIKDLWMFGDPHSHQSPGLAAIALVWFRYHNAIAEELRQKHPSWSDDNLFQHTRHHVIASLQSITLYEWLPALLGEELPPYTGYDNTVSPAIDVAFEAAAFRSIHSYIAPAIYIRDSQCNFNTSLRLCNIYFRSQELIETSGLLNIVLGMASQICEREDHITINDIRNNCIGPRHFSRRDIETLTIMRARDHGLASYNSIRKAYGLQPISNWSDINPQMYATNKQPFEALRRLYNDDISKVEVYPAGMLEFTQEGPGPLFKQIIKQQFERLRNADRFWFENPTHHVFTEEDMNFYRYNVTFAYVIRKALGLDPGEVQDNVFFWRAGDPCEQPHQVREEQLESCTPLQTFDYFSGSEASYITAFTCLGLVPFACIMVAVVIGKYKKWRLRRETKKRTSVAESTETAKASGSNKLQAQEWLGIKKKMRSVDAVMEMGKHKISLRSNNKEVRGIELSRVEALTVWVAGNKARNTLLIHVPKEYDSVLITDTEETRNTLLQRLSELAAHSNKPLHRHECTTSYIYENANTRLKRQQLLTRFFRSVFAEAYNVKEVQPTDELQLNQCKEIVSCELSRSEFAEALALKQDSLFVQKMFSIIDRDQNGYVSFRELLYAVLLFTKGSCEDKMRLLFTMYDVDKSGTLSKTEVSSMIKSMMDSANAKITPEELDGLVSKMFAQAGAESRLSLRFEDFADVMSEKLDMLWDVCLDFKGTKICMPKTKGPKGSSDSINKRHSMSSHGSSNTITSPNVVQQTSGLLSVNVDIAERTSGHHSKAAIMLKKVRHFIENHRQHLFYLIIYFSICIAVFMERFFYYYTETEHLGYRSMAGSGISLTRGAAAGISFTFSLLLLTMCRNTITLLRGTFINLYIPFDSHVTFHKLMAYTALFFSVVHIIGYCFNFYQICTQPVEHLCVFDEVYLESEFLPKVHFWLFGNVIGMTGVLLVVCLAVIYVFATQISRTHIFNAFWITHKLAYLLYILILLHGSSRIIQDPMFWYYFIGPGLIFMVDKMISLARAKREISVIDAELLPSDVTRIEFKRPRNFEYMSGQWVRLAVAPLGREEYHSFTLTSAPNEDTLSVHIRTVGPWTMNIRNVFDPDILSTQPFPTAYIDGPYGAGQQDWFKYEVSVLVGGGIGVTPYASILKDFVHMTSINNTYRVKCQKLYFVWVTASQKHFEWFIDILNCVEERDVKCTVETHIFITQLFHEFDLRTTMLYLCEEHFQKMSGKSMFTGLAATTHFGRPNFENILDAVSSKHPRTRKVGVFSCGPPGLTKGVQKACYAASARCKTRFEHHFENF